jgi:uncharacterized caspase-like protein
MEGVPMKLFLTARLSLRVILPLFFCSLALSSASAREWRIIFTYSDGRRVYRRVEAELYQISSDGQTAYLRNEVGEEAIPITKMSPEDKEYVQEQLATIQAAAEAAAAAAVPATPPPAVAHDPQGRDVGGESAPRSTDGPNRRLALLIGVGDYTDLTDLELTVPDITSLREKLIGAGFATEDVVCMTTQETDSDLRPTVQMLQRQLNPDANNSFMGRIQSSDFVLIAMSGHGVEVEEVPYFCPCDADPTDPNTMISVQALLDTLRDSPAKYKLVLIDACRNRLSQSAGRDVGDSDLDFGNFSRSAETASEDSGVMIMQSCATGQISWENRSLGHGVFMYHLMEGLTGEADEVGNQDGVIQLLELYSYASDETADYTREMPGAELQTPVLQGEFTDFDFTASVGNVSLLKFTVRIDQPNGPPGARMPIAIIRRNPFRPQEAAEILVEGSTDAQGEIELRIPMERVGPTDQLYAQMAYMQGMIIEQQLVHPEDLSHQILIASQSAAVSPSNLGGAPGVGQQPGQGVPPVGTPPGIVIVPPGTVVPEAATPEVVVSPPQVPQTPSWTEGGSGRNKTYRDNLTGRTWSSPLGSPTSRQIGPTAQKAGFRIPSVRELQLAVSHGLASKLPNSVTWVHTSTSGEQQYNIRTGEINNGNHWQTNSFDQVIGVR